MSFLINVVGNVVANVLFWLSLGAAFLAASRAAQSKFVRFFGIGNSAVELFLSNLWDAASSHRPIGFTISRHELLAAQSVNSLMGASPMRLPEIVRGLVDTMWLRGQPSCKIEVSPPSASEFTPAASMIVVGANARNSVRRYYVDQQVPRALLYHETGEWRSTRSDDVDTIVIRRTGSSDQTIRSSLNIAVVEKVQLPDHGRTIFFCAGIRADSTFGATAYLARNWRKLERAYGMRSFILCLGFPKPDVYLEEYTEPTMLAALEV